MAQFIKPSEGTIYNAEIQPGGRIEGERERERQREGEGEREAHAQIAPNPFPIANPGHIKPNVKAKQNSQPLCSVSCVLVTLAVLAVSIWIKIILDKGPTIDITCPNNKYYIPNTEKSFTIDATQSLRSEWIENNPHFDVQFKYKWKVKHKEIKVKTLNDYLSWSSTRDPALVLEGYSMNPDATGTIPITLDITVNATNTWNDKSYTKSKKCVLTGEVVSQPILGIDLGTTYSCIAYQLPCQYQKDKKDKNDVNNINGKKKLKTRIIDVSDSIPGLIRTDPIDVCIPTAVYFKPDGKNILIGESAMEKLDIDPENVIYDVKRVIGREKNDPEVEAFKSKHKFRISTNGDHFKILVPNLENRYHDNDDDDFDNFDKYRDGITPEEALAIILQHLVKIASRELGIPYIRDVVVSVPAYFHNGQRRAIRSACHIASLNPIHLVVEPSAAAIAHQYYSTKNSDNDNNNNNINNNDKNMVFMAFDFGGGTLDCSVVNCAGIQCLVLSVEGNSTLGGIDFDHVLMDIIVEKLGYDPNIMPIKEKIKYKYIATSS